MKKTKLCIRDEETRTCGLKENPQPSPTSIGGISAPPLGVPYVSLHFPNHSSAALLLLVRVDQLRNRSPSKGPDDRRPSTPFCHFNTKCCCSYAAYCWLLLLSIIHCEGIYTVDRLRDTVFMRTHLLRIRCYFNRTKCIRTLTTYAAYWTYLP